MDSHEPNPFISLHLPLTLLGVAAIFFFSSQIGSIRQGTDNMEWQAKNAEKVLTNLKEAKETLTTNVEKRKELVAQSEQTQKQFTDLMKELDVLARSGDKDAEMIIKGYGIKVQDPVPSAGGATTPPPTETPAPAPAATPAPAPAAP